MMARANENAAGIGRAQQQPAFQVKTTSGEKLSELNQDTRIAIVVAEGSMNNDALVKKAIKDQERSWGGNKWAAAKQVRKYLVREIEREQERNTTEGVPGVIDTTDLFDPEAREYGRAIAATPIWNRPALPNVPRLNADGSWRSKATEMLRALDDLVPEDQGRRGRFSSYATAVKYGKRWD